MLKRKFYEQLKRPEIKYGYKLTSKERGKTKTVYVPLCAKPEVEQWARRRLGHRHLREARLGLHPRVQGGFRPEALPPRPCRACGQGSGTSDHGQGRGWDGIGPTHQNENSVADAASSSF